MAIHEYELVKNHPCAPTTLSLDVNICEMDIDEPHRVLSFICKSINFLERNKDKKFFIIKDKSNVVKIYGKEEFHNKVNILECRLQDLDPTNFTYDIGIEEGERSDTVDKILNMNGMNGRYAKIVEKDEKEDYNLVFFGFSTTREYIFAEKIIGDWVYGREPCAVSRSTYEMFAKRYNIPIKSYGKIKKTEQLRDEIKEYERKTNIKNGLYF